MEAQQWYDQAYQVIKNILMQSIPEGADRQHEEAIINELVDQEHIPFWAIAFTHRSVDPNDNGNYESFELLGDKLLGVIFTVIVQEQYRKAGMEANPGRVTELLSDLMSAGYQGELAEKWGLLGLLMTNAPLRPKSGSDIFESFFGMLCYLGDNIAVGVGYVLAYNVLRMMLSDIDMVTYQVRQFKVYINEVLTQYKATFLKPKEIRHDNLYTMYFVVPAHLARQWKLSNGEWIQQKFTGTHKNIVRDKAYEDLAKRLQNNGITTRSDPNIMVWNSMTVKPLYIEAKKKGIFKDFRLNSFKYEDHFYTQLVGVNNDGYMQVIDAADFGLDKAEPERAVEMLKRFLSTH